MLACTCAGLCPLRAPAYETARARLACPLRVRVCVACAKQLVNDPREFIDYVRVDPWADNSPNTADDLVERLRLMLEGTKPGKGTPLAERLWEIEGRLEAQKEELVGAAVGAAVCGSGLRVAQPRPWFGCAAPRC